jgi:adenylate cyclase
MLRSTALALIGLLLASLSAEAVPLPDTVRVNALCDSAWDLKSDDPDRARRMLDEAIRLSRAGGFLKGEATASNFLGVLEDIHGRPEEAIRHFRQALALRGRIGDRKGMASVHNNLGNIHLDREEFVDALREYQASLRILEELGDGERIARAHYSMALAHAGLENYPEALDQVYRYLGFAEEQEDTEAQANALNLIGTIKAETELTGEALSYFERVLRIREGMDDPYALAVACQNLGAAEDNIGERFLEEGRIDSALAHQEKALAWFRRALELNRSNGDAAGEADILLNLGVVHKNRGQAWADRSDRARATREWDIALDWLQRSRTLREAEGLQDGMMALLNAFGDVHRRRGELDRALQYTMACMDLARAAGNAKFIRTAWKDLSRIYALQGRWKEAYEARKEHDDLRWKEFNAKRIQDYERREVQFGDEKKQRLLERREQELKLQQARLAEARTRQRALAGGGVALVLLALLLYNRNRIKTKANRELAERNVVIARERERSDNLLLNILPRSTAEELKERGQAAARRYPSVTVLFTDFTGFTALAAGLSPEDLVAELDTCFRAFDAIAGRHGLEKIKTIGDAYLCAGGLPEPLPDHAAAVVRASLDMQAWVEERHRSLSAQGRPAFRMRAGIHTGPVVAGVVGDRKFAYDIWGDTVNTAQRMEGAGEPGRVNVSEATRALLGAEFHCTPRGDIAAKGKGSIPMFWVEPSAER